MSRISRNGIVEVNRGDSLSIAVPVNIGTNIEPDTYMLTKDDAVYFGLMECNYSFESAIVKKKLSHEDQNADGIIHIKFNPDDTLCLLPGKYYYQIKLAIHPNTVVTLVDKTQFFILE